MECHAIIYDSCNPSPSSFALWLFSAKVLLCNIQPLFLTNDLLGLTLPHWRSRLVAYWRPGCLITYLHSRQDANSRVTSLTYFWALPASFWVVLCSLSALSAGWCCGLTVAWPSLLFLLKPPLRVLVGRTPRPARHLPIAPSCPVPSRCYRAARSMPLHTFTPSRLRSVSLHAATRGTAINAAQQSLVPENYVWKSLF